MNITEYTLTDLITDTKYWLLLGGKNSLGVGAFCSAITGPPSGKINITVSASTYPAFLTVATANTFEIEAGKTWADIKDQAEGKVSSALKVVSSNNKPYYTVLEWLFSNATGTVLTDDYLFAGANVNVYAVAYPAFTIVPKQNNIPLSTPAGETVSIAKNFNVAKFEVSWDLWITVRNLANANCYNIVKEGQMGACFGSIYTASDYNKTHPVAKINLMDVFVWCNVYTEMMMCAEHCVYLDGVNSIKNSNDASPAKCKSITIKSDRKGFRLPIEAEWEYVTRYKPDGLTPFNTASGVSTTSNKQDYA